MIMSDVAVTENIMRKLILIVFRSDKTKIKSFYDFTILFLTSERLRIDF